MSRIKIVVSLGAAAIVTMLASLGAIEIPEDTGHCKVPAEWTVEIGRKEMVKLARREALEQDIMACMAGRCTMGKLYGYKVEDDENWRASDDYKQTKECALRLRLNDGDSEGAELLIRWLERKTDLLIERLWPQIRKLAFALLEHDQLTGEQVREVLADGK